MAVEFERLMALFAEATEKHSPNGWDQFLDEACAGDAALRAELEQLLAAHFRDDSLLDKPPFTVQPTLDQQFTAAVGSVIGPYKLRECLGEGGFGVVYVAEQEHPIRRKVALKLIKPGMDSREVIARFEAERQALAMMDHPHVARVLDAGTTEQGRPYFVMELVHGIPITAFCDQQKQSLQQRLELFIDVCHAVQHAHQKGVIHRDIKPTNVLVTLHDGRPVVKVIDFGVAKALNQRLTAQTVYTSFGQMIGTPLYMSPEQAEMSGLDVDTRTDIYSLGVLLYELLTGTTPFDRETLNKAGVDELRRIIRQDAPLRPSVRISTLKADLLATVSDQRKLEMHSLRKSLQGDLDWIVMKALEKDRNRRYESASAFADDVGRYIDQEPVQACPPSTAYRLRKFVDRNRRLVVLGCLLVVFLLCSTIGLSVANVLISRERSEAGRQRTIAAGKAKLAQEREQQVRQQSAVIRDYLYAADMQLAAHTWDIGDSGQTRSRLQMHEGEADTQGFEWHYLRDLDRDEPRIWKGHRRDVFRLAYSRDGSLLASASRDRSVIVWNVRDGTARATLRDFKDDVNSVAFSDDGRLLATAEEDPRARVWDWENGCEVASFTDFQHPVAEVFLIDEGRRLVATEVDWTTHQGGRITVWDLATQQLQASVEGYRALALNDEAGQLAGCDADGNLGLWQIPDLKPVTAWTGNAGRLYCARFTPDGRGLATGTGQVNNLNLWRLDDLNLERFPSENLAGMRSLAFTADGSELISLTERAAWIWDVRNRTKLKILLPNHGRLWSAAVSPDGQALVIGCGDGSILLYDLPRMTLEKRRILSTPEQLAVAIDPMGGRIAVLNPSSYTVVDSRDGLQRNDTPAPQGVVNYSIAFSGDGRSVWIGGTTGWIYRSDPATGTLLGRYQHRICPVGSLAVSPAGSRVAANAIDGTIMITDAASGRLLNTFDLHSPKTPPEICTIVGFLNEQTLLLSQGPLVTAWDAHNGDRLPQRFEPGDWIMGAAVSHDGKTLAVSTAASIQLWDIPGGRRKAILTGRASAGRLAFSPDGRTLAAGNSQAAIELWHVPTGQVLFELTGHTGSIRELAFSADGRRLISVADTREKGTEVFVWGVSSDLQTEHSNLNP